MIVFFFSLFFFDVNSMVHTVFLQCPSVTVGGWSSEAEVYCLFILFVSQLSVCGTGWSSYSSRFHLFARDGGGGGGGLYRLLCSPYY